MLEILWSNIYYAIFIGLFFAGETVLIPAIYLGVEGRLDLPLVIAISLMAAVISDLVWYFVGRLFPLSKILTFRPFRSKNAEIDSLSKVFDKHALYILFLSKFIYGTRTIVQILCGSRKISFLPYFMINFTSLCILNGVFVLIAFYINKSTILVSYPYGIWIALGVFAGIVILFHYIVKKIFWEKWSQQ